MTVDNSARGSQNCRSLRVALKSGAPLPREWDSRSGCARVGVDNRVRGDRNCQFLPVALKSGAPSAREWDSRSGSGACRD